MTLVSNDEQTKIFVGGLSWDTTDEKLRNFFSKFGSVIDACVMKNPTTGRSKGFGFVSFEKADTVQNVLSSEPKELELDGRTIDPKCFDSKTAQKCKSEAKLKEFPKVFLGGLPSNVNETLLRAFFSKYGRVIEVVIMYNQEKKSKGNGFRGFGFLSFENEEPVEKLIELRHVVINGKTVEIKRAEPRNGKPESIIDPRSVNFTHEHLPSTVSTSSVSAAVQPSSIGSHCWTLPAPSNVSATVATAPLSVQAGPFVGPFCLPSSIIPPICLTPSQWANALPTAIAHTPWASPAVPSNIWPTTPFAGLQSCPSPYFTQIPHPNRVQASNPLLTHSTLASVSLLNSSPTAALNITATQEDSTFGPIRFSGSNGSLLTATAAAAASSPSGARYLNLKASPEHLFQSLLSSQMLASLLVGH